MYALLVLASLCVAFSQKVTEELFQNGEFNYPLVVDENIQQKDGVSTMYVSFSQRCVDSFAASLNLDAASTVTVETVNGHQDGVYTWAVVGTSAAEAGVHETVVTLEKQTCASIWRLSVETAKVDGIWVGLFLSGERPAPVDRAARSKRAIDCSDPDTYPPECSSATDGAKCLGAACGCEVDDDCFGNTDFPYCTASGICDGCDVLEAGRTDADNDDHLFCRERYPGYTLQPTSMDPLPNERVAPLNYYREVCVRPEVGSPGACQRCNQAPARPYTLGSSAINAGASGTYHCNKVGPLVTNFQSVTPICIDQAYMTFAVGLTAPAVSPYYDANRRGACGPCNAHAECAFALPNQPVCITTAGATQGSCRACASNAECFAAAADAEDRNGGANCMADGHCADCANDADCAAQDGPQGSTKNLVCGAGGVCIDATPCEVNADCDPGLNCNKGGTCVACTTNALCAANDGGEKIEQPTCNVGTGICEDCTTNAGCVGTPGANCQQDGKCLSCGASLVSASCTTGTGPNADGGEVPGQTLCNPSNGICETPCTSNAFCATKGGSDTFTRGNNCQASGACKTCTSDATCGNLDGPAGGPGNNQATCDTDDGLCFDSFSCDGNQGTGTANACGGANAPVGSGANCQANGSCQNCIVDYTQSTCGTLDGVQTPGQVNCNIGTRICVDACTTNAQCSGALNTAGDNCMANNVCLDCRNDADCASGNLWGGDLGAQPICIGTICSDRCPSNAACPANQNCNRDGRCAACATNADCAANDGPFPAGTNTECQNGVCVDPFQCSVSGVANPADNSGCLAATGRANCQKDRSCKSCTGNADCGPLDGGNTPDQPRCNTATGVCGPCQVNADCPAATPNCGANGGCYACTQSACGIVDGGENPGQPNCDSVTNICVDYCTSDDNCEDDCAPYCNFNKGCCVECRDDSHCPLVNWRGVELGRDTCRDDTCSFGLTCESDDDCPAANPACSLAEQKCVECMSDAHCSGSTPACAVGQQECVECTADVHCGSGEDDHCGTDQTCENGASVLGFGACLFVVIATVFRF